MRRAGWLVCLAFAGCQTFGPGDLILLPAPSMFAKLLPSSFPFPNLREDPLLPLASQALERGDHAGACVLLRQYAERHPESKHARAFYAEVLSKLGKTAEATVEFERAVARLQEDKTVDLAMIVHCHGRLLDLADGQGDDFHVHLHRGLGLYWLAQQKRSPGDDEDDVSTESILCKSVVELMSAHALAPDQARPVWYLHLIWRQLGQTAPAERWLRLAREASALSYLTPRELDELILRENFARR